MKKSGEFISYKSEVPPVLGSRHWHDLSYAEQDQFLMSCFEGPIVWKDKLEQLDLFDRIGSSIAHDLLSDDFYEYYPKNTPDKERLIAQRLRNLENTLLGERCLRAFARMDLLNQGAKLGTHSSEDDPMLIFEFLDAAKTKGFEYLSFDCTRSLDQLEKETVGEFSALSYSEKQKHMKDLEKEVAEVMGVTIVSNSNTDAVAIKNERRSNLSYIMSQIRIMKIRWMIWFFGFTICFFIGYNALSQLFGAIIFFEVILASLKSEENK